MTLTAKDLMEFQSTIEMPWYVLRLLNKPDNRCIEVAGEQASIGEDFVTLPEMRKALTWLVDQFGGRVEWGTIPPEKSKESN